MPSYHSRATRHIQYAFPVLQLRQLDEVLRKRGKDGRSEDAFVPLCCATRQLPLAFCVHILSASRAARCVACHGVRSHPVPVALVGECSIPVV